MNHFQMQLKMQYEVRVVEMLLLDFTQLQVCDFIKSYGRYMESQWKRGQSPYDTARFILNQNYHLLYAYEYVH
jgi:hypothetical protein